MTEPAKSVKVYAAMTRKWLIKAGHHAPGPASMKAKMLSESLVPAILCEHGAMQHEIWR